MKKSQTKGQILNLISTSLVIITLVLLSIIQHRWLISTGEKDITELYKNLSFSLYRSLYYELKDNFFELNNLYDVSYKENEDDFRLELEGIDLKYISSIGYINPDNILSIYDGKSWNISNYYRFDSRDIGMFIPDKYNTGLVKYSFIDKTNKDVTIFIYFDLLLFYKENIENRSDPFLDNYEIKWFFKQPENSVILDERVYTFSPLKSIKRLLTNQNPSWLIEVNLFIEFDRGKFPHQFNFRPLNPKRPPNESNLFVEVTSRGKSLLQIKEDSLSKQWILTILLLLGLGLFYIIILQQIKRLKKLRSMEKEFVASVTHELRTPLAVIELAADNMQTGIIKPDRILTYGDLIKGQSRRLTSLIEGILLFSRLEGRSEKPPILKQIESKKIEDSLKSIKELILREYSAELQLKLSLPEKFISDLESIELILTNLIINAAKHAYNSGGVIRVYSKTSLPNNLIFTVEDNGYGVSKKEKRYIFDPFYRGERSHREQISGSGLGLFLILKKVKLLNGNIELNSPYERSDGKVISGCKFTVTIPFTKS
ncbi:HAMP domain-containing histidine kinase [Thiospirochaeta perfilievii]|uniref:histidine kinase n=1 Tax=Thiospirochaeta perfilievii TaxID=252967 RepID=A0A5C1QD57_9SPIO|nr:HAMP domain-containing sensor histidine kinase [Thiospirochaeta perfilievii]QEN06005.1 HAMP domain-containing histidine kinase [Thiospirochaeta perfilievii]